MQVRLALQRFIMQRKVGIGSERFDMATMDATGSFSITTDDTEERQDAT